ncbi:MAG: bifunctional DNA primase/polymerase [Pirellulaceae bacterium]
MTTEAEIGKFPDNYVFRLARKYRDAGLSVIPLRLDGSKAPSITSWIPYRERLPTDAELGSWFSHPDAAAVGLVCGWTSGGLEVLDFDDGDLFQPWYRLVSEIVDLLPVIETGGAGWHVLYRCEQIGGNRKIAADPQREKQTLIESRGEGGYIVAEGSPYEVHASGLPYAQYSGPYLPEVPTITPAQRVELWRAARTFDKQPEAVREQIRRKHSRAATVSADVHPVIRSFNERHSWHDILAPAGWTSRDGVGWTRPGKNFGASGKLVTSQAGEELLTVFSGNAGPLAPLGGSYRTWGKFEAWAAIVHGGDRRAAFQQALQEVAQ